MKKFLVATLAITLLLCTLASCGTEKNEDGGKVFGFTSMDNSNPFFVAVLDTIKAEVEKRGDRIVVVDAAQSQKKQNEGIENLISQKIDGLFLNPFEAEGIDSALDSLKEANIPVINFDTKVKSKDKVVAFVGTDNETAGRMCGEDLAKRVPAGGNILLINFPEADSVVKRQAGFLSALEGKGFTVAGEGNCHGDEDEAKTATAELLKTKSDVVAIFAGNDPMAKGAMKAAEEAGLKNVLIYSIDGSPDIKSELAKEGTLIAGTAAQSPVTIAKKAVEVMYDYLDGTKTPSEVFVNEYLVQTFLITAENVKEYGVDGWQ